MAKHQYDMAASCTYHAPTNYPFQVLNKSHTQKNKQTTTTTCLLTNKQMLENFQEKG